MASLIIAASALTFDKYLSPPNPIPIPIQTLFLPTIAPNHNRTNTHPQNPIHPRQTPRPQSLSCRRFP